MAIWSAHESSLGASLRSSVRAAARRRSLPPMPAWWVLAAVMLCALAGPAAAAATAAGTDIAATATAATSTTAPTAPAGPVAGVAQAVTGSGAFALELKLEPGDDARMKVSLSRRVGQVSSSLQHQLGGAVGFKVGASLSEKWRHYKHSGSLTLSGSIDSRTPGASWSQISMSAGSQADQKVISWQPQLKLDVSVRQYPINPARDYVEAKLTAKGQKALEGEMKPSIKGELSVGHKEMPGQPKWTADFWTSMLSLQWRPAANVKAEASLAARQRAYPAANHKSYTTYAGTASAAWALPNWHSLDFAASASSTVRPNDSSKDRRTKDVSVKWSWKSTLPAPVSRLAARLVPGSAAELGTLALTARATAGTTDRPNAPADNTAWRAGAGVGLTWELSKAIKLGLGAETNWSLNAWDDDGQDDEEDICASAFALAEAPAAASVAGKRVHRLTLTATAEPFRQVTLSGKAAATRTDELKERLWASGNWEPSVELRASYKF